jgi:MFS family permease
MDAVAAVHEELPPGTAERRLVIVISAVVFVDTMFYAVIAPLLPRLTHELHLSKSSAGVMTASYAAGTLFGSLPGGLLALRAGPRLTVCAGLSFLACSTIAFGFLGSAPALDAARFVEGVGGACSWAGGLAWIVVETRVERRGAVIGQALGAAIGGSLLGPAIGALAALAGRPALFCAIGMVAAFLIVQTNTLPSHEPQPGQGLDALIPHIRRPDALAGMWLMALPAAGSGLLNVLGPLRLHRLGAGAGLIGAAFLLAAGAEAALSPLAGRISDRHGRLIPLRAGLAGATGALLCFTLPGSSALLAIVIVVTAAALGWFWAPAMALLSDAADQAGLDQGLAAALMNLAWAGGQILGSGVGGAVAKAAGDILPTACIAGLCAITLAASTVSLR